MRWKVTKRCSLPILVMSWLIGAACSIAEAAEVTAAPATGDARAMPSIAEDGTVHVPPFDLPPSAYMSPAAKLALREELASNLDSIPPHFKTDYAKVREQFKTIIEPLRKRSLQRFPINIEERTIGGVHTVVVTPRDGIAVKNRNRVLINLHGGAFAVGDAQSNGVLESAPLASMERIEVISVDYRQGPEFEFPAASEDVVSVYREMLKHHLPQDIGIFGCSAGGLLTAQAVAWIQKEKLPRPGAIGIFCASADATWGGDAYFTIPPLRGRPAVSPTAPPDFLEKYYYGHYDLKDPMMSPVVSQSILRNFPPTLLITGTRSLELGAAANTHAQLIKAGVDADLHVWDGMWHGFYLYVDLPESQEAFDVMVTFFDRHLGRM